MSVNINVGQIIPYLLLRIACLLLLLFSWLTPIVLMLVFRFELNTMCPYLYIINKGLVNISYERNPQL